MILINLLPHREDKRRQRKQRFFVGLGVSAAFGAVVVGLWYLVLQHMIGDQQTRNNLLKSEIARLDGQIKDIAKLKSEIEALKARQQAVEDLQSDRNAPVHLLEELVRQAPEGVYLTAVRQTGNQVAITGIAQTNERVSELLRNTSNNSPWLEKPQLVEIKAVNVTGANREPRRMFEFQIRVSMKRAAAAAAGAASAPAGAPAANPPATTS